MLTTSTFNVKEKKSAEITIPFGEVHLTFEYPSGRVNSYRRTVSNLLSGHIALPTAAQNVAILYQALKNRGDEFADLVIKDFNEIMLSSTCALYVPNEGIYFQDFPDSNIRDGIKMNESKLKRKLEGDDKTVRFFKFGSQPSGLPISKKPSVIALCGEEAAEQLEEISGNENATCNRYIMGNAPFNKPTTRTTELSFSDTLGHKFLKISANNNDDKAHRKYFGVHRKEWGLQY
jgi:hypothetical protein